MRIISGNLPLKTFYQGASCFVQEAAGGQEVEDGSRSNGTRSEKGEGKERSGKAGLKEANRDGSAIDTLLLNQEQVCLLFFCVFPLDPVCFCGLYKVTKGILSCQVSSATIKGTEYYRLSISC